MDAHCARFTFPLLPSDAAHDVSGRARGPPDGRADLLALQWSYEAYRRGVPPSAVPETAEQQRELRVPTSQLAARMARTQQQQEEQGGAAGEVRLAEGPLNTRFLLAVAAEGCFAADTLFVAARGTEPESTANLLADLLLTLTPLQLSWEEQQQQQQREDPPPQSKEAGVSAPLFPQCAAPAEAAAAAGAAVHTGFLLAYLAVRGELAQQARTLMHRDNRAGARVRRVVLTGHSLGGALATLAALDMCWHPERFGLERLWRHGGDERSAGASVADTAREGEEHMCPLTLLTWGCPHVGNRAFAALFGEGSEGGEQCCRAYRAINWSDPVPRVIGTAAGTLAQSGGSHDSDIDAIEDGTFVHAGAVCDLQSGLQTAHRVVSALTSPAELGGATFTAPHSLVRYGENLRAALNAALLPPGHAVLAGVMDLAEGIQRLFGGGDAATLAPAD